ncbi:hypothetical protein ABT009_20430 [Streptomyces sp. NPDC002896]|uniref:hypothetical protein n=1 Tax=Streptomyces sp. NPDC002896 TaxID=3154438 RepID=UPI003330F2A0
MTSSTSLVPQPRAYARWLPVRHRLLLPAPTPVAGVSVAARASAGDQGCAR